MRGFKKNYMPNLKLKPAQPIGIFDSGAGGLTVARAVIDLLPQENIIYFGDTAHFPYGDKSQEAVCGYARKITELLLEKNCKLILIACNSASAAAYDMLKEFVGERALILNVIDPTVEFLIKNYAGKKVGLIATKLTVRSNIYGEKLQKAKANIQLHSLATPLITQVIEEGFCRHKIVNDTLDIYLNDPKLKGIEALVLACTHYPLIKEQIRIFYKNKIDVIDPSAIVAAKIKEVLAEHHLLHTEQKTMQKFYVSDYTESFAHQAKLFFGQDIELDL